ncbi:MAG: RNA polymerase sigma-70 factor [Labilibaculum sp.]|nr:RNA polymerase sigma-70 factor [Labilibaculum sp.]MBI9058291.1 RNA polymerase sigma-70 factor [Labilibaculum sp.]
MNCTPLFLDKLKKGDRKSYEKLYIDLFPSLVVFARKYVGDDSASEDLVQEVFISLWQNSSMLDIHTSLKSYLYSTVRNSAINYLNKKAVEEKRLSSYPEEESLTDEELILSQDVYYHIYNAIKDLPKKSQEVIRLSLNGLSISDIQDELGVSKNTVKTHKRRAFAVLREKLKKLYLFFSPLF